MTIQTLRREVWYRLEYVRRAVGLDRASPAAPHLVKRRLIQELQRQQVMGKMVLDGAQAQHKGRLEVMKAQMRPNAGSSESSR